MKKLTFILIIVCAYVQIAFAQVILPQQEINREIEKYAETILADWKIPGMSVAITKDNQVVFAKGFGVKDMNKSDKADENTLYQIGSVSKSFTAAVMASLVDEGLISWEDTVKNFLPDFQMYDKWVEQNLLVKDMMTHKTGLRGQVGTYIPNLGYSRDDIYKMLPLIKPAHSFRNVYAYNNITFIIASKLIEKLTGKSWEENVFERIFNPLGMTSSTLNGEGFIKATQDGLATTPHSFWFEKDSINLWPLYGEEQAPHWLTVIGPAGSVVSSAADMSKWAMFHLNKGKVGDEQIISEKNMNFLHRGITITSQDSSRTTLYGHCWFVEQNSKYRLYFHTGTTWGSTALCFFLPELNLGGIILVNSEAPADPRYSLMRRVIDLYYGFPERDYNAEYLAKFYENSRKSEEKESQKEKPEVLPAPPFKALSGHYTKDELFGDATIELKGKELYITIGKYGWKHKMKHDNGNKFSFESDGHTFPITFVLNEKGDQAISFEVDFNYDENFGPWVRSDKKRK